MHTRRKTAYELAQDAEDKILEEKRTRLEKEFADAIGTFETLCETDIIATLVRNIYRVRKSLCLDPHEFFAQYGFSAKTVGHALKKAGEIEELDNGDEE